MVSKISEKFNINKIPLYLFYLGLTIELVIVVIDRSALPPLPDGQIYRVTFLLFALKVCLTKYTKKEWIWLILFVLFTALMYFMTGQNVALRAVFFVAAMRDIEIKFAMKYAFWLSLTGLLIIVTLSFFGIGRELMSTAVYRDVPETRYHFGIGHPNTFFCMILMLLLLLLYCYHERLKAFGYIILFAALFGLNLLADSRTGFAVCALAVLMAAMFYFFPHLRQANGVYFFGIFVFLLCIGFSLWVAYISDSGDLWTPGHLLERFDQILSARLKAIHWEKPSASGRMGEWTLFAVNADYDRFFDMGWVRLFYWFGIIPGALFCALHLTLLNVCRKEKDYMGLMMIVVISVYTIAEPQFISLYLGRNYLLYLFGAYWWLMLGANGNGNYNWWQIKNWTKHN